jgi:SNW domain-containing protein 1
MYDQRLFNQTSGMSSGFSSSDAYNLYDKPLFNATAVNIYKPTLGGGEENSVAGVDTSEFKSMLANRQVHKGFAGTDGDAPRAGPVQFEKEAADVFGVDAFMKKAKRGRDNVEDGESRKR